MDQPVSTLNLPTHIVAKLAQNGFHNCTDVAENLDKISAKVSISEWTAATQAPKAKTALELFEEESHFGRICSLIPELDVILQSVAYPGTITELCGFPGTGKTQVCMHLAVGVQDVVFIHTNKNLSPDRLREICGKSDDTADSIMGKIFCVEASSLVEMNASLEFLESWLESHNVKLLIIDSISWPLREQDATKRAYLISTLFQRLRLMSKKHNFAIILTNDMTTRVASGKYYNTSSFGESFYHLINNRILLERNGENFTATVSKNVNGSRAAVSFKI